jgi:hypothetical protein
MKIGAEDKKKVIIMAVLLVVAVPLLIYNFSSVSGSSPSPSATTTEPGASASRTAQKKSGIPQMREKTLDPSLRTDILAATQKIEYTGGSRNIFKMQEAPVKIEAIGPVRPQPTPLPAIIPPPPPPPIPLKYYGFSNRPGEAKKAFLQDGDNIFVAVEGDVVERRYRIVKITNTSVLVEDVLNNNQQNINLTPPQTTGAL